MASIINGLFAARAGIQAHGTAIAVLADNIANANTTAYKISRPEFTDLLAGSITGGGAGVGAGSGSSVNSLTQLFNQGSFEFTGRGLDLGVDGNGFFVVEDAGGQRFYSRAGNFKIDEDGNLLNQNNLQVLGFPASGSGSLEGLNVNAVSQQSVASTTVTVGGNLDASSTTIASAAIPSGAGITFADLSNAAQHSTTVDIFDSLGTKHAVSVFFFHTDSGEWTIRAYVDGGDINGGTVGEPVLLNSAATPGVVTFDNSGVRTTTPTAAAPDISAAPPAAGWSSGADSTTAVSFLFTPFTQFSIASSISSLSQDGKGGGSVVSFNVEPDGTLFGLLNNGQTATIGKVALATFANPEGLLRQGESLYAPSSSSGEPIVGEPNTGQFGSIQAGALETSNTDLAGDFIKLISLQRGFQGSSRIINNINDLLNELIQLA